jgi:uncharacterized protein YbcI
LLFTGGISAVARARRRASSSTTSCILSDIYTQVEKTLIEAGKADHVRDTRQLHQIAMEADYRSTVEEVTGREVIAFVSSVHIDPDVAFEVFILEPIRLIEPSEDGASQDGASRKTSTE